MIQFYEVNTNKAQREFELKEDIVLSRAIIELNRGAVEIKSIEFNEGGQKYLEFMVRSLLNVLIDMNIKVISHVYRDFLVQFGFNERGEIENSTNINLFCACKKGS